MIEDAILASVQTHALIDSCYSVTSAMTGALKKQLLLAQDFDLTMLNWGSCIWTGWNAAGWVTCRVDVPSGNPPQLRQAVIGVVRGLAVCSRETALYLGGKVAHEDESLHYVGF